MRITGPQGLAPDAKHATQFTQGNTMIRSYASEAFQLTPSGGVVKLNVCPLRSGRH